ncbi:hypothetical protein GCM10009789_19350 [Kribbella sancticallisti]|uniref:Uncharacterized protein n=1 Tax=Kribbella sancticallisti TaxID=460087 RepID=A0ABN2CWT4_9ACTN
MPICAGSETPAPHVVRTVVSWFGVAAESVRFVRSSLLVMNPDPWSVGWSAVSTMLTAVAVLVALFVAVRDTLRVNRLLAAEANDRRRGQASQVSAWATSETEYPDVPPRNIIGSPWYAAAHVLNSSPFAISDVEVEIGSLNTAGNWESFRETERRSVLPPGGALDASFTAERIRAFSYPKYNILVCRLSFRDNAGMPVAS